MNRQKITNGRGIQQQAAGRGRRRAARRGAAIIGVLFFILITSFLLMGVGTFAVSHQTRVKVDSDYVKAMDLAEAGANYEFRKLSLNVNSADSQNALSVSSPFGVSSTSFRVQCLNRGTTTPWTGPGASLDVISTGTCNGVSRSIRVSAKETIVTGRFAIFTMNGLSVWMGGSMDIAGDVGTNATLDFNSTPNISGSVYLYGSDANLEGNHTAGYTLATQPQALTWPTVSQIANSTVSGGLATLATFNNNASANPPIVGNSITGSVTLTAGNYYITNMNLTGNNKITFDNRNGPVNIWVGPQGGNGTCVFRGGTAAVPISQDSTKTCHVYVATTTGIEMAGNERVDALIYAYNKTDAGASYGYVNVSGNPTINGQLLANQVDINGNVHVNYTRDLIQPTGGGYFGFDDSWVEVNAR